MPVLPDEAIGAERLIGLGQGRLRERPLEGGRADLRPVMDRLDALLCADPDLGRLPGRFLFTLDDGRGDLLDRLTRAGKRGTDLGSMALGDGLACMRGSAGSGGRHGEKLRRRPGVHP